MVIADEIGYLLNARVLAGGLPGDMANAPFYRGGSSLLVAPLFWLSGDPEVTYRLALGLNAALAAALFPLLYLLLTRCFEVSPRVAVWPAFAAASFPTVTTLSEVVLAETLLFPLTVAWLVAFGLLFKAERDGSRAGWAMAVGVAAGALWIVHGRMLVVVVLTAAALVGLRVRRRLTILPVALGLGILVAAWVSQRVLNDFLTDRNYGGRHVDEAGERLSGLTDLDGALSALRSLVGQAWYVAVASLGVVLLLVVTDAARAVRRSARGEADVPDLVLALLLGATTGLLIVSAVSFTEVWRPDMLIYGRYVEPVVPPLLAIGVARLATRRAPPRLSYVFAILASLTLVVAVLRAFADVPERVVRWNVGSLPFLTRELVPSSLVGAAIVAAAAAGVLVAVARRWPYATGPVLLLLFLPTTAYEGTWILPSQRDIYPASWTSPEAAADKAGAKVIAYDRAHDDGVSFFVYQWWLPHARFAAFDGRSQPPPSRFVFSSSDWTREHPDRPARALWRDPGRDQTLWKLREPAG